MMRTRHIVPGVLALLGALLGSGLPLAVASAAEKAHGETKGGMPQLDPSTFASQIFWLAVTFILFFLIAWRVALPKIGQVLEDRRERIERDVSRAVELRNEAEGVLAEYEKLSAEGRASAQVVIREANQLASAEAAVEHEKLGKRLASDVEQAERRIDQARTGALEGIAEVSAEIAQSAAEKLIGVQITTAVAKNAVTKAAKELG